MRALIVTGLCALLIIAIFLAGKIGLFSSDTTELLLTDFPDSSLWQNAEDSLTINNANTFHFEQRLYLQRQGAAFCVFLDTYMGGQMISSTRYEGKYTRGRILLYSRREYARAGTRITASKEPLVLTVHPRILTLHQEWFTFDRWESCDTEFTRLDNTQPPVIDPNVRLHAQNSSLTFEINECACQFNGSTK